MHIYREQYSRRNRVYYKKKRQQAGNEQMVSLALIASIVFMLCRTQTICMWLPLKLIYFCLLFFSRKYGIGRGGVAGAVSGCHEPADNHCIAYRYISMMGIIPAMFRRMGRIPCAAAFIASASLLLPWLTIDLTMREISAVTCASVVFLLPATSIQGAGDGCRK